MENNTAEQAPEPVASVQERAERLFTDDEQSLSPEAASEAPPAEETFEFEVEGDKYVLPKKLEKAVLQEKDYTQKSQTLAEQRKDLDRQLAQIKLAQSERVFEQSVAQDRRQLEIMDAVLEQYDSLSLKELSPQDAMIKMLERDQLRSRRTALDTQIKGKRAEFDNATKAELDRIRAEASETLKKRINWNDETEKEVRGYARDVGLTDEVYDSIYDPVHKQILWEASQYRRAKAGAQPAVQQVKAVKTTSANPMPQAVKEKLAFRKAVEKTKNDPTARRKLGEAAAIRIFS